MSGDHTEKPCPLDWLNRWGLGHTCSSAAFLPMPVDRELAVGGGCEAAAL